MIELHPADLLVLTTLALFSLLAGIFHGEVAGWPGLVARNAGATLAVLGAAAITPRVRQPLLRFLLRTGTITLAYAYLFSAVAGLQMIVHGRWLDDVVLGFEHRLFGVQPTLWLERFTTPALTEWLMFCYVVYLPFYPLLCAIIFWKRGAAAMEEYFFTLGLANVLCDLGFILLPVASPLYWMADQYTVPLNGYFFTGLGEFIRFRCHYPGGSLPSPHAAAATVMWLMAWKHHRPTFFLVTPVILSLYVSTFYGRYHYLTDAVAGIAAAALAVVLAGRLLHLWNHRQGQLRDRHGQRPADRVISAHKKAMNALRQRPRFPVMAILWTGAVASFAATDPPYYAARATWHESRLASLQAISRQIEPDTFAPFESPVMRGGEAARHIQVSVAGAKEIYLLVVGIPDVKWGVADWADARLIGKDGSVTSVSASKSLTILQGRMERDLSLRSGLYQKLRLGDRLFEHGLQVQADSAIRVPLEARVDTFEAWIGVDAWAGTNGHVRFSVTGPRAAARHRLWELLARDFSNGASRQEMRWEMEDRLHEAEWSGQDWAGLAQRYADACRRVPPLAERAGPMARSVRDQTELEPVRQLYYTSRRMDAALAALRAFPWENLRRAVEDLAATFPDRYPQRHLERVRRARGRHPSRPGGFPTGESARP